MYFVTVTPATLYRKIPNIVNNVNINSVESAASSSKYTWKPYI